MRIDDDVEPVALNGSGAALWDALAEPHTTKDLASVLAMTFDVSTEQIEEELQPTLDDLVRRGIVEVQQ